MSELVLDVTKTARWGWLKLLRQITDGHLLSLLKWPKVRDNGRLVRRAEWLFCLVVSHLEAVVLIL